MNLEDKSEEYYQECLVKLNYSESQTEFAKEDYKSGYNQCVHDVELIQKANPKMSASDLVKELKKLL